MDNINGGFPRQSLSYKSKNTEWRKRCIKFADSNTLLASSTVRKTVAHKKINYDLYNGIINMKDVDNMLNPGIDTKIPTKPIQHYPIMNSKIRLLLGEERATPLDYRVTVTNPEAVSAIEEEKKASLLKSLEDVLSRGLSEEEQLAEVEKLQRYYTYDYQDFREIRANCLLNHYSKEQNFPSIFNDGFADSLIVHEELYQTYIEAGEPKLKRLNPQKVRAYGMGSSDKIEDADMIVIEDYWPLGKIIDTYHDTLKPSEIRQLEDLEASRGSDLYGDTDPRWAFQFGGHDVRLDEFGEITFSDGIHESNLPYDMEGNIRVLQVYWKSLRKIKEIKRYDAITGKPEYVFRTEDYIIDEAAGEEERPLWVNEAWHGVMIGSGESAIYTDMGPCQVQYNSITNPSKCHFGIIGTIYNVNEQPTLSLVDMMKPLSYMYDVTKARLNRLMDRNLGKIVVFNESMMPDWSPEKAIHFLKNGGFTVVNPMKEGTIGAAIGKLAGSFNNISPVMDLELGNSIANMMQFLQFVEQEMDSITGITPQRMGAVQNRETVGGIERSNVQSSHVTRWYFSKHDDTKKRVMEAFLETAKIAMRGKSKKFDYILPDHSKRIIEINGDVFAESDYGLVVDNSYDTQAMNQSIDQVAQAAMQNNTLLFSTFLKLKRNCSMAEKIRMLEADEQRLQQQQQQAQQQQSQLEQQKIQAEQEALQQKMQMEMQMNTENNETKVLVANIQAKNQQKIAEMDADGDGIPEESPIDKAKLEESIRQFNARLDLDNQRLAFEKDKQNQNVDTKLKIAKMKPKTTSK